MEDFFDNLDNIDQTEAEDDSERNNNGQTSDAERNHDNIDKSLFGEDEDDTDHQNRSTNNETMNDQSMNDTNKLSDHDHEHEGESNLNRTLSVDEELGERKAKKHKLNDDSSNQKEVIKKKKLEQQEDENKKMQVLMANFSDEQLNRYEMFRRAAFTKSNIKKIIQTICGKNITASVVIAMSGIAKVFVGEMVESALDIKENWNETGPIQPKHLREAYRLFKQNNKLASPHKHKKTTMFN